MVGGLQTRLLGSGLEGGMAGQNGGYIEDDGRFLES